MSTLPRTVRRVRNRRSRRRSWCARARSAVMLPLVVAVATGCVRSPTGPTGSDDPDDGENEEILDDPAVGVGT